MKKLIRSFLYIIPLLILGAVFISSVLIDTNSNRLNISETEMSATPNIEFAKIGLAIEEENPILPGVESASTLSQNLVFIPSSHDFNTVGVSDDRTYNFQLRNDGTQTSGTVFLFGDYEFSCVSGCSYNLLPAQSQYVSIRFTPCDLEKFDTTIYAGNAQATATGEGTWIGQWCD